MNDADKPTNRTQKGLAELRARVLETPVREADDMLPILAEIFSTWGVPGAHMQAVKRLHRAATRIPGGTFMQRTKGARAIDVIDLAMKISMD